MKLQVKNRLVMTGGIVAARRPSSHVDAYSWVWVIPLESGKFRVAAVEIPKRLVDDDECFFEEDMETPYLKVVDQIDEVDTAVRAAGVDPEDLDAPWHSDFPL